jgi:uncharacterized protein (DUF58 family)
VTPVLALRGRLIAAAGALFVAAGALHPGAWPLVAMGTFVVSALMTAYLFFYPTAIFLRRRKVELAWWVPPGDQPGGALTVDIPFSLYISLRNRGQRVLRVADMRILAGSGLTVPDGLKARVPSGHEVEVTATLRAQACGMWVLHGALLTFGDPLGLFEVRAYFPSPISLKVFPKLASPRAEMLLRPQVGALHERVGVHTIRRRGLAGELREIRDHAHGDPFKRIAWKATARRRRLMVRELENEIVVTHQILCDVAGTMRDGPIGRTPLDWGIELASAWARAALEGGDRVGLVTFDGRVVGHVKPGEGRPHFLRILDRLLDTKNVVDADLTDLTDGELVASIARYLLHQEGVDFRLTRAPAANDPAWGHISAGPSGELYDLQSMRELTWKLTQAQEARRRRGPREAAVDRKAPTTGHWARLGVEEARAADLARLRAFCRLRGVELPYRTEPVPGRRAAGLAEALRRALSSERSQLIVVVSDLHDVIDDVGLHAIRLARQRHHHIVVVAPFGPAFRPIAASLAGKRVYDLYAEGERLRLAQAGAELRRRGVSVLPAGPGDSPEAVMRRLTQRRGLQQILTQPSGHAI